MESEAIYILNKMPFKHSIIICSVCQCTLKWYRISSVLRQYCSLSSIFQTVQVALLKVSIYKHIFNECVSDTLSAIKMESVSQIS